MYSYMVISSFSTRSTSRVTIVTNPVINHDWGKDRIMITTNGAYPWSFARQLFRNG
jgi:hypothetical protein